jgi:hypothetical protein
MNEQIKEMRMTQWNILYNSKYDTTVLNKIIRTNYVQEQKEENTKTKLAKFTKFITKLFKNFNLKVSSKNDNTVGSSK